MALNKKYILQGLFVFTTLWILYFISTLTQPTETIPISSWSCRGKDRNRICEFTNFCIDRNTGPFIIHPNRQPPKINMGNVGEEGDYWFEPKRVAEPLHAIRMNQTLFVYGLYSPFHFSHFLYNGLMPLFSTMIDYNVLPNDWTLRVDTYWNKHTVIDLVLPTDKDMVLESKDVLTDRQMKPSYQPMCFARAVVGTGNRCSLWYCDSHIPSTHYASFKQYVFSKPHEAENSCLTSVIEHKATGKYRIGLLNRKHTRHITNMPELIDRLKQEGDFAIESIDFDQSACDIVHTAQAVKDLDILIAPFGNGLGAGLFMKEDAALISISARWYSEDWFKYPMTAIGRRIFNYECDRTECQEFEPELAASILKNYDVKLNETEMNSFVTEQYAGEVMSRYLPGREWDPIHQYHKDVSRKVDVDKFLPYLRMVLENKPNKNMTYPETCQKENVCCDTDCGGPLERNILKEPNPWQLQ